MAVSRYDQRKVYEAEEANSIGTEYVRAELLSAHDGDSVRRLLRDYLDERILFYQTLDEKTLQQINTHRGHRFSTRRSDSCPTREPDEFSQIPTTLIITEGSIRHGRGRTKHLLPSPIVHQRLAGILDRVAQ